MNAAQDKNYFRDEVVDVCKGRCVVTGIDNVGLLIASHIKPWKVSDDVERLDGHNGLLLSPHIDKLFDSGYITFSSDGDVIRSKYLPSKVLEVWNIEQNKKYLLTDSQNEYMKYHREHIFENIKNSKIQCAAGIMLIWGLNND